MGGNNHLPTGNFGVFPFIQCTYIDCQSFRIEELSSAKCVSSWVDLLLMCSNAKFPQICMGLNSTELEGGK